MPLKALSVHHEIQEFIDLYDLPEQHALATLKSRCDCQEFLENYYGRSTHLVDDLMDFREDKIDKNNVQIEEFMMLCACREWVKVFEDVFLQNFTAVDMEVIKKAIDCKKVTLELLFWNFKEDPQMKIMRYVL